MPDGRDPGAAPPDAWDDARAAADRAGVDVVVAESTGQQRDARAMFDLVWPTEEDGTQVTPNLLRALIHAGGYCSLAVDRASGTTVGAALGFPALDERRAPYLHSHMAGVVPELRDRSVGTALKLHQRAWAVDQGFDVVAWTFDPLVRRNARLNLLRLGVRVPRFYLDFYGEMTDAINAGDRTDRLLAWWEVGSARAAGASSGQTRAVPDADARAQGAKDLVTVTADGTPCLTGIAEATSTYLIALPQDIVALRSADRARALEWRMVVREAISSCYAHGLVIDAITEDGRYVVLPAEGT